jgi:hypothetical protein
MNKCIRVRGPFCTKIEAYYSALQITRYLKPPTELHHKTAPIVHEKRSLSPLIVLSDIHDKERISEYSETEDIL